MKSSECQSFYIFDFQYLLQYLLQLHNFNILDTNIFMPQLQYHFGKCTRVNIPPNLKKVASY